MNYETLKLAANIEHFAKQHDFAITRFMELLALLAILSAGFGFMLWTY